MCAFRTKRGSTYYFRRVIPAELGPMLGGKSALMQSRRAKDREHAKLLVRTLLQYAAENGHAAANFAVGASIKDPRCR